MLFLTVDDDGSWDVYEDAVREAWERWKWESCVERHGDHLWLMSLEDPDDGGGISVWCEYCLVHIGDLYPDAPDMLYGEVVDPQYNIEIEINAGQHGEDAHYLHYDIPVNVQLEIEEYFNPLDMIYPEYDHFLILSSRS